MSVSATPVTSAASELVNFSYVFTLNVTNASIDYNNVSIAVTLTWAATSTVVATSTSCPTSSTCNVTTTQFPLPSAPAMGPWGAQQTSAQEDVAFPVTTSWMASMGFNGGDWPQGMYNLSFNVTAMNSSNGAIPVVHTAWTYGFFLQDNVLSVTNNQATVPIQTVPFTFSYTLNLTNAAITPLNVSLTLQIVWLAPGCGSANLFGGAECPVLSTVNSCLTTCTSNSTQFNLPTAALGPAFAWQTRGAEETLGWMITPAVLNSTGVFPSNQYAQGMYQVNLYVNYVGNSSNALSTFITPATPAAAPAVSYPVTIAVTVPTLVVTSTFTLYQGLPASLDFQVGVSNATPDMNNLTITVEIDFVLSSGANELVTNNSVEVSATGANTSYSVAIDHGFLAAGHFAGGQLPTGLYLTTVWLTATNPYKPGASAWTGVTIGRSQHAYFIVNPMSATFLSPDPNANLPLGNVTLTVQYMGDFVNGANLTIYSGSTPVFVTGIFHSGTGAQTAVVNWPASGAGTYNAVVALTTPTGSAAFNESFSVIATSNLVYVNHTSWENSSLIPGVDSAVAGTILLVVGLIVGMIVALFLGRMMWGGSRSPTAPQQWTPKAANECSVCHQSFASETELKDHQKSAHGMA
ncbi:MAG: hypothetical protein ACREDK_08915 [Thermoplasmata archaeon]